MNRLAKKCINILLALLLAIVNMFAQHNSATDFTCPSDVLRKQMLLEDPVYRKKSEQFERKYVLSAIQRSQNGIQNRMAQIYTVPVVVHIIHSGEAVGTTNNPSDATVLRIVKEASDRFRHTSGKKFPNNPYSGVDCEIQFCLAQKSSTNASTTGIMRYQNASQAKPTTFDDMEEYMSGLRWDVDKYANLFIVTKSPTDYPFAGVYTLSSHSDFTVYESRYFWSGLIAHEMGHYFSLDHTFGGGCTNNSCLTDGDRVCDTPPKVTPGMAGATSCANPINNCTTDDDDLSINNPFRPVANGGIGDRLDGLENYMDYTGGCWDAFTQGQKARMRLNIETFRMDLVTNNNSCSVSLTCSAPSTPLPYNITNSNATVTWAGVTGAKDYTVQYKRQSDVNWASQTAAVVVNPTATLMGLQSGTTYLVRIVNNCTNGVTSLPSPEKSFTTLGNNCVIPTTTVSNITYTTARINWSALTGISGYEVRYKVKGAANWLTPTKTALATATFIGLTNLVLGTTYEYQIRLKCTATNSSEYSPTREFTTQTCTAPAAPTASQLTLTSARIDWAGVVGSLGYELRYRAKGATSWIPKTATATTTFINLTNLLPGTTYEYELRLKCTSTGFSAFSSTKEFKTVSCGMPNPFASDMTLSTTRISWTAIGGGLGYELRYRAKGATTWTPKTATATTTFLNLTNLLPGTTYEYELRLKCTSTGFSAFSLTKEFKTVSCGVPTPSVLQRSYATARIGWTTIGGALGYELRYRVKGVTTWTPKTATATATFIDLTALKINTVYEYEMRLKCTSTGFSAYTATREFSTNLCLPVTPSVKSLTAISIVVGWTPQTGVSGYEVSYRKKGATTWIAKPVTGAATSSFNLTALTKSTTYEIRMLTKCLTTNGSSAYSNIIEVTTPAQTGADESALQMPKPLVNKVFKENRMTISPNPTNGIVTLQINNAERGIGQIIVSDYLGKIILNLHNVSLDKGEQTQAIDLSNWSNGVYIIQITRGDWQESKKVLLHK